MRTADADILIIPGWSSSGEDHWQTRWERSLKTARRVEQADWLNPVRGVWVQEIVAAIKASTRPVILVGHSLGVIAAVHALGQTEPGDVKGAFLVAPADIENANLWPPTQGAFFDTAASGFAPIPMTRLPCPSALVASTSDPYCTLERAKEFGVAWGSALSEAGDAGHINAASGHGPWPDGLMQFGWFMKTLSQPVN